MARYWVGGTAAWDGTAGTKWSTTDGGPGGASIPNSTEDVFFTNLSTGTCTISTGNTGAKSINCTGFTGTIAGFNSITVSGSVTLVAGMTFTYNGLLTINGTGTLTTAGKTIAQLNINGSGITVTLGDALTSSGTLTVTQGTFDTANYNVTATTLSSSNSNTRTINLGSSTVTLTGSGPWSTATNTNLTFSAGTSSIVCTNASPSFSAGTATTGLTFYNVSFTNTGTNQFGISGVNTFNNLFFTAPISAGVRNVVFNHPTIINGTLSTTGTAGNRRLWFSGPIYGIAQTLTVNATPSLTDADFQDIYVVGTAAPISGTRVGNLRGCRGITFDTPKTVYWNLAAGGNWSANAWAASSGGAVSTDNFPLAQDTAVIGNTGLNTSAAVTIDAAVLYTGSVDMSTRTNAMTFAIAGDKSIYGDWVNGSGTTLSYGSGQTIIFSGRNTQTITSAGKTFSGPITIDSYGGSVELADALNAGTRTLTITNGTFDTKNYNVTAGGFEAFSGSIKTITLGSSTVSLSESFGVYQTGVVTFNAGTSTINVSQTTTSFYGGGLTLYNVNFTSTSSGTISFLSAGGSQTFANMTVTAPSTAGLRLLLLSANQTITGTLTVAGASPVRRIFVQSGTLGTTRTLTVGTLSATDCDFRDITIAGTAAGSSPTRAGDCGGNSGITFPSPKTVYWNLAGTQNWSATAWASSSGGTPDINNFPLAQDTAVFDNTGSAGDVSIDQDWNLGTFSSSSRTSAMSFSLSNRQPSIHGDFIRGTGVTTASASGSALIFRKRGTQTITSNGANLGFAITIDSVNGVTQLADAIGLSGAFYRILTLTSGTFDAVSYNVTAVAFTATGSTLRTLKMGSGTWTLSGTASIWNMTTTSNLNFYKGTANIVLSDTSTSARTFAGGSLSYNKLTIGGATGTSTLNIVDNNQFTELASTKTVAHTIALAATAQTFGAWTVTGTLGNVVTLTGTGTAHLLAGACTSGIDYLAMGSIGFSASSPGEFYAGANSTGTAGAPVYRTAKPADSTRYWVGGTGNWSSTTKWSTSSGGGSGASVPRSHDDVVFDSASNATSYTATVDAVTGGNRCKSLTISGPASGNVTLAGNQQLFIHDDITLPATGLTVTYNGQITLTGSTTGKTITTNGNIIASGNLIVNGVGCEWTLGSALSIGGGILTVTNGGLFLSSYNLTNNGNLSDNGNSRTIDFGSGTLTTTGTTALNLGTTETNRANLTVVAGTAQINCSNSTLTLSGNGKTFYNVAFTSTVPGTVTINGANSFNNLSVTGITSAGLKNISITADQTITGTLTLSAGTDATRRHFVRSNTIGTIRTLTCAAVSMTDVDFRDITIAGVAAPASGTRIGDCKGNSGITFDAAKTVYWYSVVSSNWSANVWSATSGGTLDLTQFPLAQDTVIFDGNSLNSGATATINVAYNIGTIDMSARTTNTMTLACTVSPFIYGNWINGTGTTLSGSGTITFAGRGSQTITSAGISFSQNLSFDSPSGAVTLQDAFTSTRDSTTAFVITSGTFDSSTFNVTLSGSTAVVNSSNTNVRTIVVGSGTWSIAGSGFAWETAVVTNLTVTGTGTISLTSGSAKTFRGGGIAYTDITVNQGGNGALTISGNNTFKDITNTYKATGATNITLGTTTQRVSQWTAAGEAGRVLTVQGTSASSPATLILTGATPPNVDYLTITGVRAYSLIDTWYAGANSTNNGSLGWYFQASGGTVITASFQDTATVSDQFSAIATFLVSFQDTATGSDQVSSIAVLNSVFQDTATGSDQVVAGEVFLSVVEESVTGSDAITTILNCFSAFSDSVTALNSISASAILISSVAETSTGSDEVSATKIFSTAIAESAAGTDTTASAQTFAVAVQDQASGADQTLVAPSVFNATAQDTAQAIDVVLSNTIFPASVAEQIAMTDTVIGGYLWNPVDDSQGATWQDVNTTQTATWTDVNDSQNPGWTPVLP